MNITTFPEILIDRVYSFFSEDSKSCTAFGLTCRRWKKIHNDNRLFEFVFLFTIRHYSITSTNLTEWNWFFFKHCKVILIGEMHNDELQHKLNALFAMLWWHNRSFLLYEKKHPEAESSLSVTKKPFTSIAKNWDIDPINNVLSLEYLEIENYVYYYTQQFIELEDVTDISSFILKVENLSRHIKCDQEIEQCGLSELRNAYKLQSNALLCNYSQQILLCLAVNLHELILKLAHDHYRRLYTTSYLREIWMIRFIKYLLHQKRQILVFAGLAHTLVRDENNVIESLHNEKITFIALKTIKSKRITIHLTDTKSKILNYDGSKNSSILFCQKYLNEAIKKYAHPVQVF